MRKHKDISLKERSTDFNCFSPPVMIATCIIEISLVIYTVWRYQFNKLTRLILLMLLSLAIFQLAEYRVCTGSSGVVQWSHLGYVAITLLPALGIHIIHTIKGKKNSPLVYAAYATAAGFIAYFALTANSIDGHACLGNYVLFQVNPSLTWLYALYYYGWIITGALVSLQFAKTSKTKRKMQALEGFAIGYISFLAPTTTANLLNRATLRGIPSIMCGFAVILALIAVFWVMPRAGERRITQIIRKN